MLATLALTLLLQADPGRIEQLVKELGSETYAAREKADQELRKLGADAVPALKQAAADPDPERARRARAILEQLEKKPSRPAPKVEATSRSLKLSIGPDGKVEAVVVEKDAAGKSVEKTYAADSMEEFQAKHPEVARQFRMQGRERPPMDDLGKSLQDWMRRFEDRDFGGRDLFKELTSSPFFRDLFKDVPEPFADLLDNPEEFMERFRELQPGLEPGQPPAPRAPRAEGQFGVSLAPVGEALSSHLGLPSGEGALVVDVAKGSRAEKAGLREMDIVLSIDGRPVKDAAAARQAIREKADGGFAVEVMRSGKRETLKAEPKSK
ncbi:MAG TPA: PDZ domain-containing protein [Planctomycetota bacterium]|nr:PDZ domain-containing protein [Planctomycetota bacterium]